MRDGERPSPRSEVAVASADTGTRPVPARASVMPPPRHYWNMPASAGLITTANRLSGAQPGKLRQSHWAIAVGYNSISPNVIKSILKNIIALPLCDVFNKSLLTGCFPDKLKIAKVILLYKGDDKRLLNNYRLISVLPAFSKILERLMYKRLFDF